VRKVKKDKKFDIIFDECLERMLVNGETIEQCLERYPEYVAELEPLLLTATATSKAIDITPSPEFKARARYHLRVEMANLDAKKKRFFLARQPRWAVAVVTALVVLLLGSGTVLAANSESTLPGNPLYTIKMATENVRLALTSSDSAKAELYATLVDRRTSEIGRLMEMDKTELVEWAVNRLKSHLANIYSLSPTSRSTIGDEITEEKPASSGEPSLQPAVAVQNITTAVSAEERTRLQVLLGRYIVNHPDEIRAMLEEAPLAVKRDLTQVIVTSVNKYVATCQEVIRASNRSQDGANSNGSNGASDDSNQQSGASDEQPNNSNQQPGNSSQAPDSLDPQSSIVKKPLEVQGMRPGQARGVPYSLLNIP